MDIRFDNPLAAELCYALCKRMVLDRQAGSAGARAETFDDDAYYAWRAEELNAQFAENFDPRLLADKDVLDFGCGVGDLCFLAARSGARSVLGMELEQEGVDMGRARAEKERASLPVVPEFVRAPDPARIDLPDASIDVILCFDVLEHVMEVQSILSEWRRVLRPGGRVLIWWCPWFHPYGPHIESLVPLPWAHAVFSERILIDTCSRLYEMPDYQPRLWDFDAEGKRLPNKWLKMRSLPEVNKLTIAELERELARVGLSVGRREVQGFGSKLGRLTRPLTRLRQVQEFFAAAVIYELVRAP